MAAPAEIELPPFRLDGEVALVTGASSGLGARFAEVLAAAGAKVVLAARREAELSAVAARIGAAATVMDVRDLASVRAGFDFAERAFGRVTVLVNNAGVGHAHPLDQLDDAAWQTTMAVNLDGAFRVAREAGLRMKAAGNGGSIINVASILGLAVGRGLTAYAVSKAAVVQMTKAMALELAPDRIRVNALAPGYFQSEMTAEFLNSEQGRKYVARFPFGRAGAAGELDGPLLLLASKASSYMTGTVLAVDGGALLGNL